MSTQKKTTLNQLNISIKSQIQNTENELNK